jgi:hypothetical protein
MTITSLATATLAIVLLLSSTTTATHVCNPRCPGNNGVYDPPVPSRPSLALKSEVVFNSQGRELEWVPLHSASNGGLVPDDPPPITNEVVIHDSQPVAHHPSWVQRIKDKEKWNGENGPRQRSIPLP